MLSKISAAAMAATAVMGSQITEPKLAGPWTESVAQVTGADRMDISIALPSTNIAELEKIVQEVSTPGSPSYGKHLSAAEVRALTKPDDEHVQAVVSWLRSHGVFAKLSASGTNVVFNARAKKVEEIFETNVRRVRNTETGVEKLRSTTYSTPEYLDDKIQAVFGLHGMPLPPRKYKTEPVGAGPANVNPATINAKYNIAGVNVTRSLTNRQAVAEFQGQNGEQSDLNKFFAQQVSPSAYKAGDELIYKVVGTNGRRSGTEAALDIQYIMGVAPGIKTEFWGYPGNDFCKDMNEFTSQILGTDDAPFVFSVSYGWQGELSQLGCNPRDITTTNDNFKKLAARGISVLISSGDSGSQYQNQKLYPSWPASSPYVTAVGGTRFVNQSPSDAEMATDQFGSGGGFSQDFDRAQAQWQEADVTSYVRNVPNKPPASAYPAGGRGTPDMSGIAEGYAVFSNGFLSRVGGTSASAPMFAAIVSLLNEARIQVGKAPLGLLNPFLYENAQAFTDVTLGTGAVTRSGYKMAYGWDCTEGWDAATGLGTPRFDRLLAAALALP